MHASKHVPGSSADPKFFIPNIIWLRPTLFLNHSIEIIVIVVNEG